MTEDQRLCNFLQTVRPHVEEGGPEEISGVKVLDLVEGEEVALPEKGEWSFHFIGICGHFDIMIGSVLTQEEIDQLIGKLESVTTTLQEKEKEKLKERKVSYFS